MKICEKCGKTLNKGKRFCSYACARLPLVERFWRYVKKTDTCWVWTGNIGSFGYGRLNINGKITKAHRISFELLVGKIPNKMHILHKCDNPPCVNPNHLYLGTDKENGRDRAERKRIAYGERSALAKFPDSLVVRLREIFPPRSVINENTAAPFGISARQLRDIINFKTRKHINEYQQTK